MNWEQGIVNTAQSDRERVCVCEWGRERDSSSILSDVEFYEQGYKISSVNCFIKMGAHGTTDDKRLPFFKWLTDQLTNWLTERMKKKLKEGLKLTNLCTLLVNLFAKRNKKGWETKRFFNRTLRNIPHLLRSECFHCMNLN